MRCTLASKAQWRLNYAIIPNAMCVCLRVYCVGFDGLVKHFSMLWLLSVQQTMSGPAKQDDKTKVEINI